MVCVVKRRLPGTQAQEGGPHQCITFNILNSTTGIVITLIRFYRKGETLALSNQSKFTSGWVKVSTL